MTREDLDVPADVRRLVLARDGQCCRVCGRWVDTPALHHIRFRSHGRLHTPENLVTVGWLPGHDCHLRYAHGPEAKIWAELLTMCVDTPGVTAVQLWRWCTG